MLLIPCPHCGPRNSSEFSYHGERHTRPDVGEPTPVMWRTYLYTHDNRAASMEEEWFHAAGCRRFLSVERDTVTNEIFSVRDRGDV